MSTPQYSSRRAVSAADFARLRRFWDEWFRASEQARPSIMRARQKVMGPWINAPRAMWRAAQRPSLRWCDWTQKLFLLAASRARECAQAVRAEGTGCRQQGTVIDTWVHATSRASHARIAEFFRFTRIGGLRAAGGLQRRMLDKNVWQGRRIDGFESTVVYISGNGS